MASNKSLSLNGSNGRQYSSDSFDRFGDDLCQLLLSYLPFKDKFRYECVSKQWKRLIFNKIDYFDHNFVGKTIDESYFHNYVTFVTDFELKNILQKCYNLKRISLTVNERTLPSLSLLSDNCSQLKSIELILTKNIFSEDLNAFGQTFGSKVETLDIHKVSDKKEFLALCPNVRRLRFRKRYDWVSVVGNQLMPTLNNLKHVVIQTDQMSAFAQLTNKYEKTLKIIEVSLSNPDKGHINQFFQHLSRLQNLESLQFTIPLLYANANEGIPRITTLNNFLQDNLSDLMPNIKIFKLISNGYFSYWNRNLIDLSRLKHLKRLELSSYCPTFLGKAIHSVDDSGVIHLLDNCKQLKELKLDFCSNITEKTINKLKELANNRSPKERTSFCANPSKPISINTSTECPENLSLNV